MEWINWISKLMIPAIIVFIPLYAAYFRKVPVYESFVEGAKEGFPTAVQIIPHLVGMMVAVSIFRETGAMQFYLQLFQPILSLIRFPEEAFPLALLRPDLRRRIPGLCGERFPRPRPRFIPGQAGVDDAGEHRHHPVRADGVFRRGGIRRSLYAVKVGLLADLAGFLASWIIVTMVFGG